MSDTTVSSLLGKALGHDKIYVAQPDGIVQLVCVLQLYWGHKKRKSA